jgi:hypothetical protein
MLFKDIQGRNFISAIGDVFFLAQRLMVGGDSMTIRKLKPEEILG